MEIILLMIWGSLLKLLLLMICVFIKRHIFFPEKDFEWAKKFFDEHIAIKQEFEMLLNEMNEKLDVTDLSKEENKVVKQDSLHFIPFIQDRRILL